MDAYECSRSGASEGKEGGRKSGLSAHWGRSADAQTMLLKVVLLDEKFTFTPKSTSLSTWEVRISVLADIVCPDHLKKESLNIQRITN